MTPIKKTPKPAGKAKSPSAKKGKTAAKARKVVKKPLLIAALEGFGYTPIEITSTVTQKDAEKLFDTEARNITKSEGVPVLKHRMELLTYAEQHGVQGAQPLLTYSIVKNAADKTTRINLDVIGINRGVAEAFILETLNHIASSLKLPFIWHIGCVGEKDSFTRFEREVTAYYRRHMDSLPAAAREKAKTAALELLSEQSGSLQKLAEDAPKSINFLSDISRTHFKEFLEYPETSGTVYEVSNHVVPRFAHETYICAEAALISEKTGKEIATMRFSRYDGLSKHTGLRREMPAAGGYIEISDTIMPKEIIDVGTWPIFYLTHVGNDPRRVALRLLSDFERFGMPLHHGILKDKLSSQMIAAENARAEYILLLGQKEYVEKTIVVRNTINRSEQIVPQKDIAHFLMKLKK